jgi:HAMP domain-containing protein
VGDLLEEGGAYRMSKTLKWIAVAALGLAASFGSVARADVDNASATNVQEGDNDSETNQSGSAASGDAVAGQVAGVVSSGDTSVDATNHSEDVDVTTGDASGTNSASQFVGLTAGSDTAVLADILNGAAANVQEGDNSSEVTQAAEAASGDGVGGSVIGVVTSAGGSADVVAANTSEDVDLDTGDSEAENDAAAFVGLNATGTVLSAADVINASATNVQEGDNDYSADQSAEAASGDAVGGQVLGVVSAGDASVDATNHSEDIDAETGEAFAANEVAAFVGLTAGSDTAVTAADILNGAAANVQDGDNAAESVQAAQAASGDSVGGQVAGVVTSAGGSADLVLANTSEDSDAETGDSDFENFDTSFTGLNASGVITVF